MENLFPEIIAELKRKQIQEDMAAIRLEEEAAGGRGPLDEGLAALGDWMVAQGEKLKKQRSKPEAAIVELIKKVA